VALWTYTRQRQWPRGRHDPVGRNITRGRGGISRPCAGLFIRRPLRGGPWSPRSRQPVPPTFRSLLPWCSMPRARRLESALSSQQLHQGTSPSSLHTRTNCAPSSVPKPRPLYRTGAEEGLIGGFCGTRVALRWQPIEEPIHEEIRKTAGELSDSSLDLGLVRKKLEALRSRGREQVPVISYIGLGESRHAAEIALVELYEHQPPPLALSSASGIFTA
jgi:hypothetical protein